VLAEGEWVAQRDAKSGRTYYYHAASKKTTWDLARELGLAAGSEADAAAAAAAASAAPAAAARSLADVLAGGEWVAKLDEQSGRTYYYHAATKATTWDVLKHLGLPPPPVDVQVSPMSPSASGVLPAVGGDADYGGDDEASPRAGGANSHDDDELRY
jgi:hypothetical protein